MKPASIAMGVPTGPDVQRLIDRYATPKEGQRIPYDDIAAVITAPTRSNRWSAVTGAWRRKLFRDYNVEMRCDGGTAFVVMSAAERVESVIDDVATGVRRIVKSDMRAVRIPKTELSDLDRQKADHLCRFTAAMKHSVVDNQRDFAKALAPAKQEQRTIPSGT